MNFLLTVISVLVTISCVATGTSLWDLMPGTHPQRQKTQVNDPVKAQNRGTQSQGGGFWGQILQHSKEGQQTQSGEKYSGKNSEQSLVTIASESVKPSAGLQKLRKNIPESLRSLHTLYTDYEDYDDEYYDEDYYEDDFDLVTVKNSNAEIQTVEDSNVDQVLRTHQ